MKYSMLVVFWKENYFNLCVGISELIVLEENEKCLDCSFEGEIKFQNA